MPSGWWSGSVAGVTWILAGLLTLSFSDARALQRSLPVAGRVREALQAGPSVPEIEGDAPGKSETDWLVLPVLLGPQETLLEAEADVPLHVLGTAAYHGHVIAQIGVRRNDASRLAASRQILLRMARGSLDVTHLQRVDGERWRRIRANLETHVVNPQLLDLYAEPPAIGKPLSSSSFSPTERPSLEGSAVEMLILTRDSLMTALQPYADERTAAGIPTVVRSIEWIEAHFPHGADLQETLRLFMRQAYELWGVQSVLLAGDTDLLPARYAYSTYISPPAEVPTDLYFACLDGTWNADGDAHWGEALDPFGEPGDATDLYPELYVGRLPFRNSRDVEQYRAKLEHYLMPTRVDEQDKLLFLAEVLWPANYAPGSPIIKNGADNAERLIALNDLGTGNPAKQVGPFRLSKMYEVPTGYTGAGPLTRASAIDSMNSGYSLVTHIGHGFRYTMSLGNASMTNLQAASLTNSTQPFFLVMLNCTASAFDFPCLAEEFLLNPQGGAVAVLGAAREAFPDGSQLYLEAWFRSLFDDNRVTSGQALNEARLELASSTATDGVMRWTNFITAYLGDPTLRIWRGAPQVPTVSANASPPLGEQVLSVQVTSPQGAVAGGRVTLWKPGDFYAVAHTNLSGVASLAFRAESPGPADLRVEGGGITTYEGTLQFAQPATPFLRATGSVLVDDAGFGTLGNGNGVLEAGEQAFLRLAVENEGASMAPSVTVSLSVSDPFLSILDPFVEITSVLPGQTVNTPAFQVQLAPQVPDRHHVELEVLLSIAGKSWHDRVPMDLLQVGPRVVGLRIADADADGLPAPGETYALHVAVRNDGFAELSGVMLSLSSSDPDVSIVSGPVALGDLLHRAQGSGSFLVVESDVTQRNWIDVSIQDASGRSWIFPIETRRPSPPGTVHADASLGPDQVALNWEAAAGSDVAGYHVLRALDAGGPWTQANADRVDSATYFGDHGLEGNRRYHYAVVSVDSSGNQSLPGPVVQVTTNPTQREGWPRVLRQWTSSSIVAANVTGDARLEIFAGADRLYAWRHDGVELRDGDGNVETDGIFSALGQTYTAGLAAGDLDGDGLDEIVACSWDTRQVFVFNGDGTVLPGWPRAMAVTTHGIWGTPALADLDVDGDLEVIVLGLDGRLYVWHHDGSEFLDGDLDPATQGVFFRIPVVSTWSRGGPAVANLLTDDATPEIVFGATNDRIYVLRADGSIPAGWPRIVGDEVNASPALGDVDGDGVLDVVVPSQDGFLYALRADGTDLPGWPRAFDSQWAALMPSVALHDFGGDGQLEIVVGGSGGGTEEGVLAVFDAQGEFLPGWPVDVHSASESSPILGDVDDDGDVEILFGGESGVILGFELDGATAPGFPIRLGAELRSTPTLTDVDLDGDLDLILAGWDQRVSVFDFSGAYRPGLVPWGTFKGNAQRTGAYFPRTATDVAEPRVPRVTRLLGNVPNPFNPSTRIDFELAGTKLETVRLHIHDAQGRRVRALLDASLEPGRHSCLWDGRDDRGRAVGSGVYFSRLVAGSVVSSRKMVLLR